MTVPEIHNKIITETLAFNKRIALLNNQLELAGKKDKKVKYDIRTVQKLLNK